MSLHQRSRELRKFHRKRERIWEDHGCHEPYSDRHYVCVWRGSMVPFHFFISKLCAFDISTVENKKQHKYTYRNTLRSNKAFRHCVIKCNSISLNKFNKYVNKYVNKCMTVWHFLQVPFIVLAGEGATFAPGSLVWWCWASRTCSATKQRLAPQLGHFCEVAVL